MPKYYIRTPDGTRGPISGKDVQRLIVDRVLQPTDLVRREGERQWHPVSAVKGLHHVDGGAHAKARADATPQGGTERAAARADESGAAQSASVQAVAPAPPSRTTRPTVAAVAVLSSVATGGIVWAVMHLGADAPTSSAPGVARQTGVGPVEAAGRRDSPVRAERPSEDADRQLLYEARTALERKDFARSAALFEQLHDRDPANGRHLVALGESRAGLGNHAAAIVAFKEAIQIDRGDAAAWSGLGDALLESDELVGAVQAWERASQLAPTRVDFGMRLVMVYSSAKMWDRAIPAAERIVRECRRDSRTDPRRGLLVSSLGILAEACVAAGRDADGKRAFEEIVDLDPGNEGALVGLGRIAIRQGDVASARKFLTPIRSTNADAALSLAQLAITSSDLDEAAQMLRQSLRLDATRPERWLLLAAVEHDRGNIPDAVSAVDASLERDPKSKDASELRSRLLNRAGRHAEALAECERAAGLGAEEWVVLESKGTALRGLGRAIEAETALRRAFELKRSPETALGLLDSLGDREAWLSSAAICKQMELSGIGDASTWREMRANMHGREAAALAKRGDSEGEIAQLRLAFEASPSPSNKTVLSSTLSLKAIRLMQGEDYAAARYVVREVAELDPKEAAELSGLISNGERIRSERNAPPPSVVQAPAPSGVESWIVSEFRGFGSGKLFELANGQVWKQSEFYMYMHIAFRPRAVFYRDGIFWMMKVDGIDRAVRVERIR